MNSYQAANNLIWVSMGFNSQLTLTIILTLWEMDLEGPYRFLKVVLS